MKTQIKFVFDNAEAAEHFLFWLCESGEQEYWQWMETRENEEEGKITATNFDYYGGGKEFGKNPIIAKCGRLDGK